MNIQRIVEYIANCDLNDSQKKTFIILMLTEIRDELSDIERRRLILNAEYNQIQELLR